MVWWSTKPLKVLALSSDFRKLYSWRIPHIWRTPYFFSLWSWKWKRNFHWPNFQVTSLRMQNPPRSGRVSKKREIHIPLHQTIDHAYTMHWQWPIQCEEASNSWWLFLFPWQFLNLVPTLGRQSQAAHKWYWTFFCFVEKHHCKTNWSFNNSNQHLMWSAKNDVLERFSDIRIALSVHLYFFDSLENKLKSRGFSTSKAGR